MATLTEFIALRLTPEERSKLKAVAPRGEVAVAARTAVLLYLGNLPQNKPQPEEIA